MGSDGARALGALVSGAPLTLAEALENFAEAVTLQGSYADKRIAALQAKVVRPLARYEPACKEAKEEVRRLYTARERELVKQRQLDRLKERGPRNRQQILQAETELVKASAEFAKTARTMEEKSIEFERQKIHDLKTVLLDFITIEMGYHAKAIEVLTAGFESVKAINEDSDLERFKKSLRLHPRSKSKVKHIKSIFRTSNSLTSLAGIFSNQGRGRGIPKAFSKSDETLATNATRDSESEEESLSVSLSEGSHSPEYSPIRRRKMKR